MGSVGTEEIYMRFRVWDLGLAGKKGTYQDSILVFDAEA